MNIEHAMEWRGMVKKSFWVFLVYWVSFSVQAIASVDPLVSGFSKIIEPTIQAVVNISTVTHAKKNEAVIEFPQFPSGSFFGEMFREFFERVPIESSQRPVKGLGSGFVIDSDGYIVTNNHVVADADEITIIFHDKTQLNATLVGRDIRTDLALLKVNSSKPLAFVPWGDGHQVHVGDWVIAIGNPFGLGGTVTKGIISHIERDISANMGPNYIDGYFQTDAAINVGNSGGPLLNMRGEVIGVNTVIYSPTGGNVGLGFSIPSFIVQPVVEQLKKFGHTKRGWIGIRFQVVDSEIADSVGLPKAQGALVGSVVPKGPAAQAKIQQGDIILKINGVSVTDSRKLPRMVGSLEIGSVAKVILWRKDLKTKRYGEVPVQLTVGTYEATDEKESTDQHKGLKKEKPSKKKILGLTLRGLTASLRSKLKINSHTQGVLIVSVAPGSMAEEKGIRSGDLLLEVQGEVVSSPEEVVEKVTRSSKQNRSTVLLLISRHDEAQFVSLKIEQSLSKRKSRAP